MLDKIKTYLLLTIGSAVYGVGISQFLDPNHLAPGGVSGISIILNAITPIETGTWVFLINIPILLLGFWKFGWKFICSTVYVVAVSSVFINFFGNYPCATSDPLLAAVFGSLLSAVGLGIIFKCGSTSGGTDIIIKILRQRFPYLKTSTLFFITDVIIVAISAVVFGELNTAMYAGIAVYAHSAMLDFALYGKDEAKLIVLISDKADEIKRSLLAEDIGLTVLEGYGGYDNRAKQIILSAMRKQNYPKVEEVVKRIDPDAFLIVTSASEVYGEGYKSYFTEKL